VELVHTESTIVVLDDELFASGNVCEAFRVRFVQAGKQGPVQVAKRYKWKDGKKGFSEDHVNAYLAGCLTGPFNALLRSRLPHYPIVKYLQCTRLLELKSRWYTVEEYLEGDFTKYNNIFGNEEFKPKGEEETKHHDVSAAFSHFSFLQSDHEYAVLDVQGVGCTYTDPAIVSPEATKYGYTDTGSSGLLRFFQTHKCNYVCQQLGLPKVEGTHPLPKPTGTKPTVNVPAAALQSMAAYSSVQSPKGATIPAMAAVSSTQQNCFPQAAESACWSPLSAHTSRQIATTVSVAPLTMAGPAMCVMIY
jgi:hypothetical protein